MVGFSKSSFNNYKQFSKSVACICLHYNIIGYWLNETFHISVVKKKKKKHLQGEEQQQTEVVELEESSSAAVEVM